MRCDVMKVLSEINKDFNARNIKVLNVLTQYIITANL